MSIPPEILFHRFFQTLSSPQREIYKGKEDLERLRQPTTRSLLIAIQTEFNEALRNEKKDIPEHVDHPPFHVDYIESEVQNALAFRYEGFSFIGITSALINTLFIVCFRLSRAEAVSTLLGLRLTPEEYDNFQVVLLRTQLYFVVSHEYTHHVHGHVIPRGPESLFPNEILDDGETGNFDQQIREADADGYAVYHLLANLLDLGGREQAVSLLKLEVEPSEVQDEVLFSCFVVAVGAYLFVRPPQALDRANVYQLTHPPQAARMNCLMQQAINWCKHNRPNLEAWMTPDRFQKLMNVVAEATWGMNGGKSWAQQIEFLKSNDGTEYVGKLEKRVKAYIQSL
jgi:hypothetical protein